MPGGVWKSVAIPAQLKARLRRFVNANPKHKSVNHATTIAVEEWLDRQENLVTITVEELEKKIEAELKKRKRA